MPGPAKTGISLAYAQVNTCLADSAELGIFSWLITTAM